jgi:hypothetical protein
MRKKKFTDRCAIKTIKLKINVFPLIRYSFHVGKDQKLLAQ